MTVRLSSTFQAWIGKVTVDSDGFKQVSHAGVRVRPAAQRRYLPDVGHHVRKDAAWEETSGRRHARPRVVDGEPAFMALAVTGCPPAT